MAEITTKHILENLTHAEVPVATASIEYPLVTGLNKKAAKRINTFYEHQATALLQHVKKRLMPQIIKEYSHSLATSSLFKPLEISATFTHAQQDENILNISRDVHIRGTSKHTTETWDTISGWFAK